MLKRLALVLIALFCTTSSAKADIWLNEIHYEGTPSGTNSEFFEIVVSGDSLNIDLSDIRIQFYSSSGEEVFITRHLSDGGITVNDSEAGFKIYEVGQAGIQDANTAWSIDVSGSVFEFKSWGGQITANSFNGVGAADGMTSIDIGVQENGSNSNFSLQMEGIGDSDDDFTWISSPVANTRGQVNTGQTLTAVPEPSSAVVLGMVALGGLFVRRRK